MKKHLPFLLIFLILGSFVYPIVRNSFIFDRVYDVARDIYVQMLKYRRVSMNENRVIGFYFDIAKNEYTIFEDLNKNNIYDDVDTVLKNFLIRDISSKVLLSDLFLNAKQALQNNTFIFYPNATCNLFGSETGGSVFFIYYKDALKKEYSRMIRLKIDSETCELKISKVLNIKDKEIEFEN